MTREELDQIHAAWSPLAVDSDRVGPPVFADMRQEEAIALRDKNSGNVATAVGSGVSAPIIRREGKYFVIKYVD